MLKNISWANYWIFILVTLAAYYITIGCIYYLAEIKQLLQGKSNLFVKLNTSKNAAIARNPSITPQSEDNLQQIVSKYIDEITVALKEAAENSLIKQEIIYSLQQLSTKYSVVKNSPFKSFITDYILIECNNYCSIHLDDEEVKRIWI
jgi:hypothetical protein